MLKAVAVEIVRCSLPSYYFHGRYLQFGFDYADFPLDELRVDDWDEMINVNIRQISVPSSPRPGTSSLECCPYRVNNE
jgi:hypothetical protein